MRSKFQSDANRIIKFETDQLDEVLRKSLWNIKRWDLSYHKYGIFWDLFGEQIVFTLIRKNSVLYNGESFYDILFWYNKKLYIANNNNFVSYIKSKELSIFIQTFKFWRRISPFLSYEDSGEKCFIYSIKSINNLRFKINPVKEKLLYYWLKFNFYLKSKRK